MQNACSIHHVVRVLQKCFFAFFLLASVSLFASNILTELSDAYINRAAASYGISAKRQLQQWRSLIVQSRNHSESDKLTAANNFFNRVRYVSDIQHWGKRDYWATPAETLVTNGGDCEEYAIGKYFTLVAMGVSPQKLRITYVKARINGSTMAHMVLTYYANAHAVPLVLDNIEKHIKPANQRPDLTPVYAFNGDDLWVSQANQLGRVGNAGNIRFWQELKSRMWHEF